MKKILFGLSAILLCFMMASCGGSPTDKLKSLTKDVEKNGEDWTDVEKWDEVLKEGFNCVIEFAESDPSEKEIEEFMEAFEDLDTATRDIDDEKAEKALKKAVRKNKGLKRKAGLAIKKLRKSIEKSKKDDDADDDDDYSDDDD